MTLGGRKGDAVHVAGKVRHQARLGAALGDAPAHGLRAEGGVAVAVVLAPHGHLDVVPVGQRGGAHL